MTHRNIKSCTFWLQRRTQIAITVFMAFFICYLIRVDINVTILSMVNDTINEASNGSSPQQAVCPTPGLNGSNNTSPKISVGTYEWDRPTQGLILGAFFWGYIFTQIPGGLLSFHFGPRWVGFTSIFICSMLDLFIPTAASIGPHLLIATRILQGLAQGVMVPTGICIIGRWALPNERSRTMAFVGSGTQIGTVVGLALAGFLCQPRLAADGTTFVSHWDVTHYLFGSLGLVSLILWYFIVYDAPERHPRISAKELNVIHTSLWGVTQVSSSESTQVHVCDKTVSGEPNETLTNSKSNQEETRVNALQISVPWLSLIRCRAFWSVLICHVTHNWSFYTLITCIPTYMSRVLGFSMSDNGLLSALPYLVQCTYAQLAGFTSDVLIKRGKLSTTWVRKLNNCIALGGIGLGLLLVGYTGCSRIVSVMIFATAIGLMGSASSGFAANTVDLAPQFSGVITSLTNCVATLPGIFGPMLVGYVTKDSSSLNNWRIIFGVSASLAWFGALCNLFMTSGRRQRWADPSMCKDGSSKTPA
ncbi:hypothetical protein CRM22_004290 [Opisthorchis felineus]|uniref:Major facilitator superfamily (MFS) profile domain-containing protein n=1 Tax=Opisthorchis felineus TaxID=147828 RepID=A0A4V3SFG9_OPIFE|nr:hypothetical protein CRM22_004290 [Opisthorchis felineus]